MPDLKRFDPDTATHDYFKARHAYLTIRSQEEMPEDPPRSLEFSITNAKSWKLFEKEKNEVWHLWQGKEIIAELFVEVAFYEDNRHLLWCELEVLAPFRRRGNASLLLQKIVEIADTHQRTLVMSGTSSRMPAGTAFTERLGATKGIETHTNQLVIAELDKSLIEKWLGSAATTAKEFELGFWGDTYPEEEIQAVANLISVMSTAPKDDLQLEEWKAEPEDLRAGEAYSKARKIERWVLYVRHKLSGELAGFTSTYYDLENPENLSQGDTGVLPKYRGHGLGKWLKAAMIQKILAERPIVKRIRTGNADSNAPMLAINHALGFKPYIAETVWQIEVEKIKSYLQSKPT
jgi:mycothiol synthase